MTVKQLIKQLKKYEDFDIEANIFEEDKSEWGATVRTFSISIGDIGYSAKVVNLELTEKD